jgi:BRCA1-associated protein
VLEETVHLHEIVFKRAFTKLFATSDGALMPPYFYHLRFELYATSASNVDQLSSRVSASDVEIFLPGSGTDIFKTSFPTHKIVRWSSQDQGDAIGASNNRGSPRRSVGSSTTRHLPEENELRGNALLLPERSLNLRKDVPPSPRARINKPSNTIAATDWRYDCVSLECITMESSKGPNAAGGGLHTKAVYVPSATTTTNIGYGIVHLYRDVDEAPSLEDVASNRKQQDKPRTDEELIKQKQDCSTLCILAVPSWMLPSDLLGFVGDQAREDVSHFRLIRTGRANKYMVLMKFRSSKKARDWQKANNGRVFSAAEPENCHVVFTESVEFVSPDADANLAKFPQNTNDPFTQSSQSGASKKSLSSKPWAPPPPNLLELPTCPVCLERMDETTGLLTILCQHVFHCACLEKWRGSGCPVCRYTHSPSFTFPYPRPQDGVDGERNEAEPLCSACATDANLWICLICGNIGCGRYDSAHAYAHYEVTSHCYAMDISSQHVWDYAGDGYVHRLIQNKSTTESSTKGGSGDLPARSKHENEAFHSEAGDSVPREKMENMANEYAYLLTSQLEGQRRYFEEQVERAADKAAEAIARAEEATTKNAQSSAECEELRSTHQQMIDALARVEKAFEKSEATRLKFEQMARTMTSQLREERTMNEGLLARIKLADQKVEAAHSEAEAAKQEKKELEEMNHDLTMFISSQEKVKELQAQGEEIMDGSVSVPEPPKKGKGKGRKK